MTDCSYCNPDQNLTEEEEIKLLSMTIGKGRSIWPTKKVCAKHMKEMYPGKEQAVEGIEIVLEKAKDLIKDVDLKLPGVNINIIRSVR